MNNNQSNFNNNTQNKPSSGWLQTFSCQQVFPLNLNPLSIKIIDIAHSLSQICRFNGHTKFFYSVAQHSLLVSQILERRYKDKSIALKGLLHDASEYILCDIPRPLKHSGYFDFYQEIEFDVQDKIYVKFGLEPGDDYFVHMVDGLMLRVEARDLMQPIHKDWSVRFDDEQANLLGVNQIDKIIERTCSEVKKEFLETFYRLSKELGIEDNLKE